MWWLDVQRFDVCSSLTGKIALGCLVSSVLTARMFCPMGIIGGLEWLQNGQTPWTLLGCPVLWTGCTALHGGKLKDDLLTSLGTWPCSISYLPILHQIDVKMSYRGGGCFNKKSGGTGRTTGVKQSDCSLNTCSHRSPHKLLGNSCTSGCISVVRWNSPQQRDLLWI